MRPVIFFKKLHETQIFYSMPWSGSTLVKNVNSTLPYIAARLEALLSKLQRTPETKGILILFLWPPGRSYGIMEIPTAWHATIYCCDSQLIQIHLALLVLALRSVERTIRPPHVQCRTYKLGDPETVACDNIYVNPFEYRLLHYLSVVNLVCSSNSKCCCVYFLVDFFSIHSAKYEYSFTSGAKPL